MRAVSGCGACLVGRIQWILLVAVELGDGRRSRSALTYASLWRHGRAPRIGMSGREEFQIVRDRDWNQAVYPAAPSTSRPGVPIRGPDAAGADPHLRRSDPQARASGGSAIARSSKLPAVFCQGRVEAGPTLAELVQIWSTSVHRWPKPP